MAKLTAEDRAFVERERRLLNRRRVAAWIVIAVSALCWAWVSFYAKPLAHRTQEFLHTPLGAFIADTERHEKAIVRLRTLKATTPLEAALVHSQIQAWEAVAAMEAATILTTIDIGLQTMSCLWFFVGISMLANVRRDRRWLKVVETIEHDASVHEP